jgi:hypothetical protein
VSPEQYERVLGACREWVSGGGRLVDGVYGLIGEEEGRWKAFSGCCCPMGAVLLTSGATVSSTLGLISSIGRVLGASKSEIRLFTLGFDDFRGEGPWWEAGVRMRAELTELGLMSARR